MRSRRMWAGAVLALAVAVGSAFMIPAAVGAVPQTKAVAGECAAKGTQPLGNAGVVTVSVKGSVTTGTPGKCAAKLTGKWAKNSTTFSTSGQGKATLGKNGAWVMAPGTDLGPLKGAKLAGTLTGTGLPVGSSLTIIIDCVISYPPLKIVCHITISFSSAVAALREAGHASPAVAGTFPHGTGAGTVLCSATGTKPMGNDGVVKVAVKGSAVGSTGTPLKCAGLLTGKWKKNSTQFSWDASGPTTLGKGGTFRALSGPVMGPGGKTVGTLTGSGLPTGASLTVDAGCEISYPPLKIRCWIIISAA